MIFFKFSNFELLISLNQILIISVEHLQSDQMVQPIVCVQPCIIHTVNVNICNLCCWQRREEIRMGPKLALYREVVLRQPRAPVDRLSTQPHASNPGQQTGEALRQAGYRLIRLQAPSSLKHFKGTILVCNTLLEYNNFTFSQVRNDTLLPWRNQLRFMLRH